MKKKIISGLAVSKIYLNLYGFISHRWTLWYGRERRNHKKEYALCQHIHMSAYKAWKVIDHIRERSYEEALTILEPGAERRNWFA